MSLPPTRQDSTHGQCPEGQLLWRFRGEGGQARAEAQTLLVCVCSSTHLVGLMSPSWSWTHHHHHHVVPLARISLTPSRHFSLSFIASGRFSGLHPVSSHSCCMFVLADCLALARPYVRVHRSTSLMSSSLLPQQGPACLARVTWIVFVMGGRWPYSWCFVECCRQDLFNIARSILG